MPWVYVEKVMSYRRIILHMKESTRHILARVFVPPIYVIEELASAQKHCWLNSKTLSFLSIFGA